MKDKLQRVSAVNTIVGMAEEAIYEQTGVRYRLLVLNEIADDEEDPKMMAAAIANGLGMTYSDITVHSRKPRYVHLRQLIVHFLKMYFPEMTLKEIGAITEQDHTTVIHSLRWMQDKIRGGDQVFMPKYEQTLQAVTQFVRS